MAVTSRDIGPDGQPAKGAAGGGGGISQLPPSTPQRGAAALAMAGSFLTTLLFMWGVGVPGWYGVALAVAVEFVLQACKAIGGPIGWGAHGIDSLLNGGGLWPYVLKFDQTPTWRMLVDGLGLEGGLRNLPALVIAIAIGFLLSWAPLKLWNARPRIRRR